MPDPVSEQVSLTDDEAKALRESLAVRRDFVDEDGNPDFVTEVGHLKNVQPAVEHIVTERVAQALEQAADDIDVYKPGVCMSRESNVMGGVEVWLRDRASLIRGGGDRG